MTRGEYKTRLLDNGFVFDRTQKGYPARGEEDVYKHPKFKHKFYVTRVHKNDKTLYGFLTGTRNGQQLDAICMHNTIDDFRDDRSLPVWLGESFVKLIERLS